MQEDGTEEQKEKFGLNKGEKKEKQCMVEEIKATCRVRKRAHATDQDSGML